MRSSSHETSADVLLRPETVADADAPSRVRQETPVFLNDGGYFVPSHPVVAVQESEAELAGMRPAVFGSLKEALLQLAGQNFLNDRRIRVSTRAHLAHLSAILLAPNAVESLKTIGKFSVVSEQPWLRAELTTLLRQFRERQDTSMKMTQVLGPRSSKEVRGDENGWRFVETEKPTPAKQPLMQQLSRLEQDLMAGKNRSITIRATAEMMDDRPEAVVLRRLLQTYPTQLTLDAGTRAMLNAACRVKPVPRQPKRVKSVVVPDHNDKLVHTDIDLRLALPEEYGTPDAAPAEGKRSGVLGTLSGLWNRITKRKAS